MFFKVGVLKNFGIFKRKHIHKKASVLESLFNNIVGFKRNSSAGVFL